MRIHQLTTALAPHGDDRAIVLNNGALETTDARPFFGYRFRTARAKERHRRTIEAFVEAVRTERGESSGALTRQLLAQHHAEGRPLRKYIVRDMLHVLEDQQRRISWHNEHVTDMDFLMDHLAARPEAADLPPGLVGLAASRARDMLVLLWKGKTDPLPPALFEHITETAFARTRNMNTAERLLTTENGTETGALDAPLRRIQEDYGLSAQNMETTRRYIRTIFPFCASQTTDAATAEELLELVENHRLPGLQTLLNALSPMPPEPVDPLFSMYSLSPLQAAWLDAVLPQPGIARVLAVRHAADIFARVPAEGPPLPSDIWFAVFNEQRPSLDVFPDQLASRIREHALRKMEEDAGQAQADLTLSFDAPDNPRVEQAREVRELDDEAALSLYCLGLKYESALRVAMLGPDVRPDDFDRLLPPFSLRRLPVLGGETRQWLEHTMGNCLTASTITFDTPQDTVEIFVHGTRAIEEHGDAPTAAAVDASMNLAEQLCGSPAQRDCLLLLLSEMGTRCLRELSSLCRLPLDEHAGSQAVVSVEDDDVLLRQSFNVLHLMSNSRVTASVTYRIRPDGAYDVEDTFLRRKNMTKSGRETIEAYLEGTLYADPVINERQLGGLPGTVEALLETWRLDRAHSPLLAHFIRQSLDSDFAAPPADLTCRKLHEYIMDRRLKGLNELLYTLGAGIPASPVFSHAAMLDSYLSIQPLDKARLFRLTGPGIPYALGLQCMEKIRSTAPDDAPFAAASYWQGVFGTPPPGNVTGKNLAAATEQRLDELLKERLNGAPDTVILPGSRGINLAMLKDLFILSGMRMEVAIERAVSRQRVDTEDFVALPVLRPLNNLPPEHDCLEQLALDVYRMGSDEDPSITFVDPFFGEQALHPQRSFEMSPEEWENLQHAGLNNPIMRHIIRHAGNMCGSHTAQQRALYLALGQAGRLPFRHLSYAAHLGYSLSEHTACSVVVRRLPDGTVSVDVDTLKHSPVTGHIRWLIAPDGLGRCEALRLHPAEERTGERHVRFASPESRPEEMPPHSSRNTRPISRKR